MKCKEWLEGPVPAESFYRKKRYVGARELAAELRPLAMRLLPHQEDRDVIFDAANVPLRYSYLNKSPRIQYKDVFLRQEYLKYRRIHRKYLDLLWKPGSIRPTTNNTWVIDETKQGKGFTPIEMDIL
jgi:hypothetical protein